MDKIAKGKISNWQKYQTLKNSSNSNFRILNINKAYKCECKQTLDQNLETH
jgi:hypothetical protein